MTAPVPFLPLRGVKVVDLTSNMSGPLATMVLADQGADVVKVEPLAGDLIRTVGTGRNGMSAYFANLNRGKRSLCVDLTTSAGAELVRRMCEQADVFVQNFRPGVVERLGLGPDDVRPRNERLVYASISGFGTVGPMASAPAYDHVVQALSGFAALQTGDDGAAEMVHQGAIDKATAYTLAQAITAALLARVSSGRGAQIDVSMLDTALAFVWPDGMMNHTVIDPGKVLPPVSRSFRATPTSDGYVVFVTLTASQWQGLVDALSEGDDPQPDLSDTAERMTGGAAIMREMRRRILTMTTAEVVERLSAADVPVAPVLGLDELHRHAQIVASDIIEEVEHPVMGAVRQVRPAVRFDGTRLAASVPASPAGHHGAAVLADYGLSTEEIASLAETGTILT